MKNYGMNVQIQAAIGENIYEEWEKDLYGESPLFEICAKKIIILFNKGRE